MAKVMQGYKEKVEEKAWDGDGVPLEDSNCANIGSDEDKALRKKAAETEEAWKGFGEKQGLMIWRIENFEVVPYPLEMYGQFYIGDSYIVLHTVKVEEKLEHTIHFWLGAETSIDERGTAAYKTVELDDLLDGRPTQCREVMRKESTQFRALFPNIRYLKGGVASGFRSSQGPAHVSKLFQVQQTKNGVAESEVPLKSESLNQGDCFVLDAGDTIFLWQGVDATPMEKYASATAAERHESESLGRAVVSREIDNRFWELLGGQGAISGSTKPGEAKANGGEDEAKVRKALQDHSATVRRRAAEDLGWVSPEDGDAEAVANAETKMYEVLRGSGDQVEVKELSKRASSVGSLRSDIVLLVDKGTEVFVWIGKEAPPEQRRNTLRTTMQFLKKHGRDPDTPINVLKEGGSTRANKCWNLMFGQSRLA